MLKLGDKVKVKERLYLGEWLEPGTEVTLVGRKSGEYGTLWLGQKGEVGDYELPKIFTFAPAELSELRRYHERIDERTTQFKRNSK